MYRADGIGDDLDGEVSHSFAGDSDSDSCSNSNSFECYLVGPLVFIVDNLDLSAI